MKEEIKKEAPIIFNDKNVYVRYTTDGNPCTKCVFGRTGCNPDECEEHDIEENGVTKKQAYFIEAKEESDFNLDDEIKRFCESKECISYQDFGDVKYPFKDYTKIAKHFYNLGKNQSNSIPLDKINNSSSDLEKEIDRYEDEIKGYEGASRADCLNIARHFASWGKQNVIEKAVEWMKETLTYIHPIKGTEDCMVNINAFRAALEDD